MQKWIELGVPTSYDDITLRGWLGLQSDLRNYEGDEEATTAVLLLHLCGLQPEFLTGISVEDYNRLKGELAGFIGKTDLELKRWIWIGDTEYGFEPNLSNMAYGAYADITKFGTISIDENWPKVMNILYRPITKKMGDNYWIQKYSGGKGESKWLDIPMSVHFGALFFLFNLLTDLLSATLKYTKMEEAPPQYKQILERSGEAILQLLSSQVVISPASTLFPKSP